MTGDGQGRYIHGSEPAEQQRLTRLNRLMNRGSLAALRLAGGERVLDVGSGLGQLSREIARAVGPDGRIVAVERDADQLAEAERQAAEDGETGLVEFRRGDAVDLPLAEDEWGSFDLAHCRFLLEHVPDPHAVVAAMVRAVRPGGRVVLEDDDHDLLRMWPEVPAFDRLWRAYIWTYDRLGNDPYVGRRLVELLHDAGAEPVSNDLLFFGSCAGSEDFEAMVANFIGIIEGAPETILEAATIRPDELERALEEVRTWARRPNAAMWYGSCWAEGRRPLEDSPRPPARRPADRRPRRKVTSLQLLADSASDLTSTLELAEVFRKIAERIQQMVDCHLFCVMLWNEEAQLLEHSYSVRYGEHVPQRGGFPLGQGLSGSAAQLREPIRVADVREDSRYIRFRHAEVDIRSELAVPLVVKDRLIGVLDLESTELDAFTAEHEETITALASQIGTALENASLYEQVRANEERLGADLETARQIQTGLLPGRPPRVPGIDLGADFVAARELSGDFYDFLPYADGRVALAVGDVAGKATAAALYGSLTVGIMRGHALEGGFEPALMLQHMNNELWALEVARRFAALLFAVYAPAERLLTVANAGVPQPHLLRRDAVERIDVTGVPLGALALAEYRQREIQLEAGDIVVFASDGLDDSVDADGRTFGATEAATVLRRMAERPAAEIARALTAASAEFGISDAEVDDDRTVVVLKVL